MMGGEEGRTFVSVLVIKWSYFISGIINKLFSVNSLNKWIL